MAATVITALVAVFTVATILKFLLSTEVEEGNVGCFHRRVLPAVPVQALKIIVVVWQILTPVCSNTWNYGRTDEHMVYCSTFVEQKVRVAVMFRPKLRENVFLRALSVFARAVRNIYMGPT